MSKIGTNSKGSGSLEIKKYENYKSLSSYLNGFQRQLTIQFCGRKKGFHEYDGTKIFLKLDLPL
jgi:hypothetical protein